MWIRITCFGYCMKLMMSNCQWKHVYNRLCQVSLKRKAPLAEEWNMFKPRCPEKQWPKSENRLFAFQALNFTLLMVLRLLILCIWQSPKWLKVVFQFNFLLFSTWPSAFIKRIQVCEKENYVVCLVGSLFLFSHKILFTTKTTWCWYVNQPIKLRTSGTYHTHIQCNMYVPVSYDAPSSI